MTLSESGSKHSEPCFRKESHYRVDAIGIDDLCMHPDKFSPRALHEAKGPPAADGDIVHPFVRQCGWLRDIPQPRFPIDLGMLVQLGSAFWLGHGGLRSFT